MNTCPHCGRKLLSHISVKCNWCGTEIEDPAYLAQAEVARAAMEAEQARHDRQTLGFSNIVDGLGLLAGFSHPLLEKRVIPVVRERRPEPAAEVPVPPVPAPEAAASSPASETQGRFEHLEL